MMAEPKPRRRVIIDTDPGVDDAFAILLAFGNPEKILVEGLTVVCGNGSDIANLGANAKFLARFAGFPDTPVLLGESTLDETEAAQAIPEHIHGKDGMGDVAERFGRCQGDFEALLGIGEKSGPAAQFIVDKCLESCGPGDEITLVCIGPLGNIAKALRLCPELPNRVREVIIMGGCVHGELRGNRTPAAEANFACDPEAAQAVLSLFAGKIILADLGITHQTDLDVLRKRCQEKLDGEANVIVKFIEDVGKVYVDCHLNIFHASHAPAHDVVAVMYVVRPDLFLSKGAAS